MGPEGPRVPESDWVTNEELKAALIYELADYVARLNYEDYDKYQKLEIPENEADEMQTIDDATDLEVRLSDINDANEMRAYCQEQEPQLKFPTQDTIDSVIKQSALKRIMKGDFNKRTGKIQ